MSARRLIAATLAVASPALAALAALVGFGALAPGPALLAAAATLAPTALLVRAMLAGLASVREAIGALAEGGPPPALRAPAPLDEIWQAALRLARRHGDEMGRCESEGAGARAALGALPDPLLVLDRNRTVIHANEAAAALFGAGLAGRDLAGAVRAPAVLAAADAVLRGEAARRAPCAARERLLEATVAPVVGAPVSPAAEGGGPAALVLLHDVTAMRRGEQMRADFVANVSHELRTPLASLVGFVETLRGPARDDEDARERFLAIMQEQAARMARLIDDLLSLSRIEMNEHVPPTGRVDLAEALGKVAESLQLKAAARGMRIEIEAEADLPPALGEADEIAQVFQNLIDNAVKYGRAGTAVRVSAARGAPALPGTAETVAVSVRDEGDGIGREHLPRLTERFYRVDTARSRAAGGTGLGLAIVKHVMSRHRGALEIESERGRGSVFTAHFRAAPPRE